MAEDPREQQLARLLEFGLVKNFEYVAKFCVPETSHGGCGFLSVSPVDVHRQGDQVRQEYLASNNKTDEQIQTSILEALRKCPSLANKRYKNFAGQDMLPLWYFVLCGSRKERVEEVYHMYPPALGVPLRREDIGTGPQKFTLLDAACRCSQTRDEVVLFIAQNCEPQALTNQFHYEPLPFVSRAIDGLRRRGARHAPLKLVQALAPPLAAWQIEWFHDLFNLGYNHDTLDYAANIVIQNGYRQEVNVLDLVDPFRRPQSVVTGDVAILIEKLIVGLPIKTFRCKPRRWTREGLQRILNAIQGSKSVECLSLKLVSEMFYTDGINSTLEDVLDALENFFASNQRVHEVCVEADQLFLQAIVRGLGRGQQQPRPMLSLTLESQRIAKPMEELIQLFRQGVLEKLRIVGSYCTDLESACSALREDTTLRTLELDIALPVQDADKGLQLNAVLDLLKVNSTLEEVIIYDRKAGVDYTGFTKYPNEIKPLQRIYRPKLHDEALADRMVHYMRLNVCGRKQVRKANTSDEEFIQILTAAIESRWGRPGNSDGGDSLVELNILFGLLCESAPRLWNHVTK